MAELALGYARREAPQDKPNHKPHHTEKMIIATKTLENRKSCPELLKAKIKMPTIQAAKSLGIAWTRKTMVGHSVSSVQNDGSSFVTIYDIMPEEKTWLEETANQIANQ